MPQVDFYLLPENTIQSAALFACRLSAQLYKQGQKVYLYVNDQEQAIQLDQLMWQFKDDAFVPHDKRSAEEANIDAPVLIGPGSLPIPAGFDVLINLSEHKAPACPVERIVELAINDEQHRIRMRELYRLYRQEGYQLKTHLL